MQFSSQFKNRTDRYGSTNYPVSCCYYLASNENFRNFVATFGDGIVFAPMLSLYIKMKLRVWRAQKCDLLVSAKTAPTGTGQQTTPCHVAPYRANNENFRNFGATFCHGTVYSPMQSLY